MPTNGNTQKYRLEQVEKKVDKMDDKLDAIMTNHLPHIEQELIGMKTRINVLSTINIGAIILALLLSQLIP